MNLQSNQPRDYLKPYKECLCNTAKALFDFCNEHNIQYFACGGTAIGVVRHGGFIPWDDDIDVCMKREDYDRFLEIRNKLDGGKYKVFAMGDDNYIYPFAKFVDITTTLWEYERYPSIIGAYIDIFPLDTVSDNLGEVRSCKIKYEKLFEQYLRTFEIYTLIDLFKDLCRFRLKKAILSAYTWIMKPCLTDKWRKQFFDYEKQWIKQSGNHIMCHHCVYDVSKEWFPQEFFSDSVTMKFEGIEIKMPVLYDKYLSQLFGEYMTPPPIREQISNHYHFYLNLKEGLTISEVRERIKAKEHLIV